MDTQVADLIANEAVRESCGNQLCTVLHRGADQAMICNGFRVSPADSPCPSMADPRITGKWVGRASFRSDVSW